MEADVQAVREVLAALDLAFEQRDLAAALALCTEDVVFIGSGDGEVAVGREAIEPMFAALAPHLEHVRFSLSKWESVEVDVLGEGDVAVLYAVSHADLETPNRIASFPYRLTGVLVRREGQWLWRVHHGSEPGAW